MTPSCQQKKLVSQGLDGSGPKVHGQGDFFSQASGRTLEPRKNPLVQVLSGLRKETPALRFPDYGRDPVSHPAFGLREGGATPEPPAHCLLT